MYSNDKKYLFFTIIISIISSIIYFYLGFIFGFNNNPFSHKLYKIILNILIYIIPVIGIELIRFTTINKNRYNKQIIIFITILLTLLEIKYNLFINSNLRLIYKYICSNIIPLIFKNVLYTYIDKISFYPLSLLFSIVDNILILLLPILPNLNWFINGSTNIIKYSIIYGLFNFKYDNKTIIKIKSFFKLKYILKLLLIILFVCFIAGIFKYKIIAILSNSMDPIFNKGDIVIYKKLNDNELNNLNINSIIVYNVDDRLIVHRIVKKIKSNNNIEYITKGDANNTADYKKVSTMQIKGQYIFHIKYLGYPSILLNKFFNYN